MEPLLVHTFATMIEDHEAYWDGQDRDRMDQFDMTILSSLLNKVDGSN